MNRKLIILGLEILLGFLACFIFLWAWVCYVEPFPDRDSLSQTLYPILNYLKASTLIGNDFIFLRQLMPSEYPSGILFIPWIVAFVGLQQLFLETPWLLSTFLLIPLCLTAWLVQAKKLNTWFVLFVIFFFPPVQLCLKNLNLHSFIVLYNLAAIFLIYDYRKNERFISLILGIIFFIFTCSIKHLGIIIFINLWITFLLWKKRKSESLMIPIIVGLAIILVGIQAYPEQSLIPYFESLKNYNPLISSTLLWIMGGSALFILLFSWFQGVSEDFGRLQIEHLFINLGFFVISGLLILGIFTPQPDFHGLVWMLLSFVIGNAILIGVLRWGRFETDNGFMILAFIMLGVTALVFYFSRLGQISAFFVLPYLLLLILIIQSKVDNWKLYCLGATFFLISNFFPPLNTLESIAGSYGFRLYARGFNMIHQNPLGWQKTNVTINRKSIDKVLKTVNFTQLKSPILMGRYGIHHHDAVQFHYPNQFFYDIPKISLPEDISSNHLKSIYSSLLKLKDNFYTNLLEEARIPIILVGNSPWVKYEKESLSKIEKGNMLKASNVKSWLHDPFFEFLEKQDLLSIFYKKYSIESYLSKLDLYVHKKLLNISKQSSDSKSLKVLLDDYKKYKNPNLEIAQNYLLRSDLYLEQKKVLAAIVLLMKATQLDPDNQSINHKIEHARKLLRTWEGEILEKYGWAKLADILEDSDSLPWKKKEDWNNHVSDIEMDFNSEQRKEEARNLFKKSTEFFDKNPQRAMSLLQKVLKLDPFHEEAIKDLKILNEIKLSKPEETENNKRKAELLFKESTKFFEIDPSKAAAILTEVLRLDPEHKAAKEDLGLAEIRISKGWKGPKTKEHKKADELFKRASEIFKSNPSMAESMLKEAIKLDPAHEEALQDLRVIEIESSRIKASNLYHESLKYQQRQPLKALNLLEEAIKLDPNHEIAKRDIEQIKIFLESNSLRKAQAKWFFSKAKSMLTTNQTQARLNLRKALEMDPGNIEAHELANQLFGKE